MTDATAIVGRQDKLAILGAALDAAAGGRGSVALLTGEAGIGKTRLAEEVASAARRRDLVVAWGRTSADTGAPPLWPWVQVARSIADEGRHNDAEVPDPLTSLARSAGPGGGNDPSVAGLDEDGPRFRFFDALWRAFGTRTRRRPHLIVLDDVQWADEASVAFLQFLAPLVSDLALLIVATVRDTDVADGPLSMALPQLARTATRLDLAGLEIDDAKRLLEQRLGLTVEPNLVGAVHARTGGNPFFLTETFALLARDGRLVVGAAEPSAVLDQSLAPTVNDVVGRRIDRLSSGAQRVLAVLALRPAGLSIPLLRNLASLSTIDVPEAVDEAEAAGLVSTDIARPGLYRLHHPLVGDVLKHRLRSLERARLHLELAETLLAWSNSETIAAELAHHFTEAIPVCVDRRAWSWAVAAGDQASAVHAHEDALQWYHRALDLGDGIAGDGERIDVLVSLGAAARRGGNPAEADDALQRAVDLARGTGDAARLARVAVTWSDLRLAPDPRRGALLDEVLQSLDPADRIRRAGVLTASVNEWLFTDLTRARETSLAAVDEAEASGDARSLITALAARRLALWGPDTIGEHEAVARELLRLTQMHWPEQAVEGAHGLTVVTLERGEIGEFRRHVGTVEAAAARYRSPLHRAYALVMRGLVASIEGRLDDADTLTSEVEELCQRAGLEAPLQIAIGQRLTTAWARGVPPPIGVEELIVGDGVVEQTWRCGLLFLNTLPGREDHVAAGLDGVWASAIDAGERDLGWLGRHAALAEVVTFLEDRERAEVLVERLARYADRLACVGVGVCLGPVRYHLGRLRALHGEQHQACRDLEAAVSWAVRNHASAWAARARLALAEVVDDPKRAGDLLALARAEASDIGLLAVEARCAAQSEAKAEPAVESSDHRADGLTPREVEILTRLAAGATNVQLAVGLHLSVKTIERHLSNIYTKLGMRGRAEAAAYAQRHGLTSV